MRKIKVKRYTVKTLNLHLCGQDYYYFCLENRRLQKKRTKKKKKKKITCTVRRTERVVWWVKNICLLFGDISVLKSSEVKKWFWNDICLSTVHCSQLKAVDSFLSNVIFHSRFIDYLMSCHITATQYKSSDR